MTPEEALVIDLRIVREVFGKEPIADEHMHRGWMVPDDNGMVDWTGWCELPRYCEEIQSALTVVEKLAEQGLRLNLTADWSGKDWSAVFYRNAEYVAQSGFGQRDPALAVCRAALAALSIPGPGPRGEAR